MVENVTYKKCTCDFCGATKEIPMEFDLPMEWGRVRYIKPGERVYNFRDMCPTCGENFVLMVDGMKTE